MRHANVLIWFFALAFVSVPLVDVSAAPTGAVKLPKAKLSKKNGFYCGNVKKSSWIPGKLVSGGYFYSHQAEKANLTKQLKKAPKRNKSKIRQQIASLDSLIASRAGQCLGNSLTPTPTPNITRTATPTPRANPLKFDFSGAVGLTLKNSTGSLAVRTLASPELTTLDAPSSNLQKVDGTGKLSTAVSSGSANISKFLIAPNDKLYVLFNARTNLQDTTLSGNCLLAEVDVNSGSPNCIDAQVSSIRWLDANNNPSIQFDSSGAIYYLAYDSDYKLSLRKFSGGVSTDLINDNISVEDFLVAPDGGVIIYGGTTSSGQRWIRKIRNSGGLRTIKNIVPCNTWFNFMRVFPDNKVYFGIDDCSPSGVYRMDQSGESLEAQPWMGYSKHWSAGNEIDLPTPVAFDCYPPYTDPVLGLQLPQGCGAMASQSFRTPDGKMFFMSQGKIFKYYPSVEKSSTTVSKVIVALGVPGYLILAGLNSLEQNVLTLFNTSDNSEIQLLGPDNEIEIYNLNYLASSNKIMFDGLRFSDNKYVIGQYDLTTMTSSASQTGSGKLVDFKTF
jgi:hypothetical protein